MALLLAVFVAFVGTALTASQSLGDLLQRDTQRSDALRAQTDLQRLLTLLVDVETGQRGFIITGQRSYLQPYESAVGELERVYQDLRKRMLAAGTDERQLSRLDAGIRERLSQVDRNIAGRLQEHGGSLQDLSAYAEGKRLMDQLRYQVEELQRAQQWRIAEADSATRALQERTEQITHLLPGVGLLALMMALLLLVVEQRRRDRAEAALRHANANLEGLIDERTAALSKALARIQSFAVEQDRSIENERRRLAREVHDQIGQVGTAIKMLVVSLRSKLKPRTEPLVEELQQMADESIRLARQISAALRPPLLDELGLEAAVGHYLQTLGRQAGMQTVLAMTEAELLSADQASQLFRIIQEACTNVLRHAGAQTLTIKGRHLEIEEREGFQLEVIDDGKGPGDVRADASGLRNMRERATLAGGRFEFGPADGGAGTRVGVWLPLAESDAAQPQGAAA
ncbi:CHASE3 domain-containing protein [Paucibacter sp. R3-3]|uniref:CHASE3 domain-containing protein n=1 Tax=Roseateles agri TaxID=3098619 RepID=A0ABU5DQR0_9BURK|nr:CHASE3 domain-containing protein [Paucibacter sp. R3-3]MDY0748656.1 CHASE3 domain-containing protein [Paucibacter sp. R3-3]